MKDTAHEMADILGVLTGKPAGFGVDEAGPTTAKEVAATLLGKTVEELELEECVPEKSEQEKAQELSVMEEMNEMIAHVIHNQSVSYYTPIGSGKGFLGRITGAGRRLVRRFLEFVFAPLLSQQNTFNSWVARTLEANVKILQRHTDEIRDEYRMELQQLEVRNQQLLEKLQTKEQAERMALQERVGQRLAEKEGTGK